MAEMLTWPQYQAGAPCPGCGLPLLTGEAFTAPPGRLNWSAEERERYDAEEARYRAAHGDCHEYRWALDGYLTIHCGKCCPPPPLSPSQIEKVVKLLRG